jgi:hypothetical protein
MPENRNCLPPAIPDEGNRSCDASAGAHLAGTTKREAMLPGWGERGHKPVKNPFQMDQRSQLVGWTIKITEGVMVSGDRSAIISISGTRAREISRSMSGRKLLGFR